MHNPVRYHNFANAPALRTANESTENFLMRMGCPVHIVLSVKRKNELFEAERRSANLTAKFTQAARASAAQQDRPLTAAELASFRQMGFNPLAAE